MPWNGQDFYVAFGEGPHRNWDDAVRYGFVSGGGGSWYSKTLQQLFVGAHIFAFIPKTGYVGVGTMTKPRVWPANSKLISTAARGLPL